MSYVRKTEYKIQPEESFQIIRNCSGCGGKAVFHNTNCFRVNANGNKIDVWLIYQCSKCKHTSNLTVYERCKPDFIPPGEYEEYLSNSKNLALRYGRDTQFFARNKAEIDWANIKYTIIRQNDIIPIKEFACLQEQIHSGDLLVIRNESALKIRADKVVAEVLNLTRATIKRLEKTGILIVTEDKQENTIMIEIKGEINSGGDV
jgi:hypothetical protein